MLFQAYLFCLIVGGGLVCISLISGLGEADADADLEAEADLDADIDADMGADLGADMGAGDFDLSGGEVDVDELPFDFDVDGADVDADAEAGGADMEYEVSQQKTFNPFVSLKFWTFSAAFFGLTGVLFDGLGLWTSNLGVFILSLGMGATMGTAMAYLIHIADRGAGEGISDRDYLGSSAEVRLPVREDKVGKIRVNVRGRLIDMRAELADGEEPMEQNEDCFVIDYDGDKATVIRASTVTEQLTDSGQTSETVLEDTSDEQFDEELEEARHQQEHVTS